MDWLFKTSFIKAQHNVGELRQDITYNNDNLPSYQQYAEEVKPYKTKIREFISNYEKIDTTGTTVTDFDLPQYYLDTEGKIVPQEITCAVRSSLRSLSSRQPMLEPPAASCHLIKYISLHAF